uniref:Sphingosine-1-phosphate receptor 3a n=1 Tax=Lepisosteus oculatus TaxID=7918 RepID=W5NM83_LEPOC|nr:PREDICTED: sphingosine 1-phosphate receptor 3-like [Lepisosteus oculatus]XP_015221171.1 PREDICTED: sphingosine 1-phosphate receptor 3-like [Lepisosteus oculatus]
MDPAEVQPDMNEVIVRHYNHSGKWGRGRGAGAWKTALLLLFCLCIVLENLLVLLAIWRNRKLHSRTYFLIGNLALCDLLAGVAYVVNFFTSGQRTFFLSPGLWLAREGSMFVALSASTFSLLAIGIERHMTMVNLRPHDASKRGRLPLLLGACWAVAVLLGALPSAGWNCLGRLPACSTVLPLYARSYVAFCISVFSALLCAIVILYIRIYRLVTSSGRRLGGRAGPSEHALALLRTVVIVLGVFVCCWAPLFVLLMLDVACGPARCPVLYMEHWFIGLAVLNSALNPLIYTLSSREMRGAFCRLLSCGPTCGLGPEETARPANGTPAPTVENSHSRCSGAGGEAGGGEGRGTQKKAPPPGLDTAPPPGMLLSAVLVKASALPPNLGKL